MAIEVITKEDLETFRIRLLADLQHILKNQPAETDHRGYKTADVRKLLGCSVNKLISIRINRRIRTKKIGGTLYYNKDDIRKLLEEGF